MADANLLMKVTLLGERYHGLPEWPPSPFRVFQAMIAGALVGQADDRANELTPLFDWLAELSPPSIAAPPIRRGKTFGMYVPNNDLDTVDGDPRNIARIRGSSKLVRPVLLEKDAPICYLWVIPADETDKAHSAIAVCRQLYQLGRGIDMAYADAELVDQSQTIDYLSRKGLVLYDPQPDSTNGIVLRNPIPGSFDSLQKGYSAHRKRLLGGHLTQPAPPRFQRVSYNAKPHYLLFDLISGSDRGARFHATSIDSVANTAEQVRDHLSMLLGNAYGRKLVERIVVGRGASPEDKRKRIMITPLPSIGSIHADQAPRRIMITVPPDCPIPTEEVRWATGSIHLGVSADGEMHDEHQPQLVQATDRKMLGHYGVSESARVWRTVTPMIVPSHRCQAPIKGSDRVAHERRIIRSIRASLRHAGINTSVESIHVQKEPFLKKGKRADHFGTPSRFEDRWRYHVQIVFTDPYAGPLLLGDGRFLGLGLFAPERTMARDIFIFQLSPETNYPNEQADKLLRSTRRALMALARDKSKERKTIPKLFSGHEKDGSPSNASGRHEHLFFAAYDTNHDGLVEQVIVLAPWLCDRSATPSNRERRLFEDIVSTLEWVRVPESGRVHLKPLSGNEQQCPLLHHTRAWISETPYSPTRHPKRGREPEGIKQDIRLECQRRGLPIPEVEILHHEQGPKGGRPVAWLKLHFSTSVPGPILLGRGSHYGAGLFEPDTTGDER